MKYIKLIVAALMIFALMPAAGAGTGKRLTAPILVGGDNAGGAGATTATHLKFFKHPDVPQGKNFMDQPASLISIDDIVATPGFKTGAATTFDSGMMEILNRDVAGRTEQFNGIGWADFNDVDGNGNPIRREDSLKLSGNANVTDHRMIMADVRMEGAAGEFYKLFGADPLEANLIGNASAIGPYDNSYPSAVVSPGFKWCAPDPGMVPYFTNCGKNTAMTAPYDEVFLYGIADLGAGLVSASYDSFNLTVSGEDVFARDGNQIVTPIPEVQASYLSPLALFRKGEAGYKFSGYTSWQVPAFSVVKEDKPGLDGPWIPRPPKEDWKYDAFNGRLPLATNPIAVEAIKLTTTGMGAAVVYQTTLWSWYDYILNEQGRPEIFADGKAHTVGEQWGRCKQFDHTGKCLQIAAVNEGNLFPEKVVSPVIFWNQKNKWEEGAYEHMNPTHILEPFTAALVGPGAYHAAVLTDREGLDTREHLLVPSGKSHNEDLQNQTGSIYMIDPNGMHFYTTDFGPTISKTPYVIPEVIKLDIPGSKPQGGGLLGGQIIWMVPYQIRTVDLDGNSCQDFVVTWRARGTAANNAGGVKFSLHGRMFSNYVTVALRSPDITKKCSAEVKQTDIRIGDSLHFQIASVAIGNFNNDGAPDLVVGNLIPEQVVCNSNEDNAQNRCDIDSGKWSAYAYIYEGPAFLDVGRKRIRVGFLSSVDKDAVMGVGAIEADSREFLPSAPPPQGGGQWAMPIHRYLERGTGIAAINGLPLMLPEIGCPDYSNADQVTPVASIYETYKSIEVNNASNEAGLGFPFVDADKHPIPQRCATEKKDPCIAVAANTGEKYPLPLWSDDKCCEVSCIPLGGDPQLWLDGPCGVALCPEYDLGNRDGYEGPNKRYCNDRTALCPASNWTIPDALYAKEETGGDTGGTTEFAQRPDVIHYASNAHAIVDMRDLRQAEDPSPPLIWGGFRGPEAIPQHQQLQPLIGPRLNYKNLRLPRGTLMPGPREMTAVTLIKPDICNMNGRIDAPSEDCDVSGLKESDRLAQVADRCRAEPGATAACDEDTCKCLSEYPGCENKPGQCASDVGCPVGMVCTPGCACVAKGIVPVVKGLSASDGECECRCDSFSSEDARKAFTAWNDANFRQPTGRQDDLMCEVGQSVTCVCSIKNAAAPGISSTSLSASYSGSPLPGDPGNTRPWMMVQTGGSLFLDPAKMGAITVELVKQPLRILPLESGSEGAAKTMTILPDISSNADLIALGEISPLVSAIPSLTVDALGDGVTVVNNMIKHTVTSFSPGQEFSLAGKDIMPMQDVMASTGSVAHIDQFRIPLDYPTITTLESFKLPEGMKPEDIYIENRQLDSNQLKNVLLSRAAGGQKLTRGKLLADMPWEKNLNYGYSIVQSVYGTKGMAEQPVVQVANGFGGASPALLTGVSSSGGCKGCFVISQTATFGSVIPVLIAILVPLGGIAAGRAKRRK